MNVLQETSLVAVAERYASIADVVYHDKPQGVIVEIVEILKTRKVTRGILLIDLNGKIN